MTQVQIGSMETVIEFEPEAAAASHAGAAAGDGSDLARLRELLRPIIVDLLEAELGTYTRMRG
jgi:hypothetical protein